MTGTQNIILGTLVGIIGIISLIIPGGWDWLSVINIWMSGLLIGIGATSKALL